MATVAAKEFSELIGDATGAHVEERASDYFVSDESAKSVDGSARLVRASVILNRGDLRPIEQTLVISQGEETREYHFTETNYERRAPNGVAPSVFEPEPELLSERIKDEGGRMREKESASPLPPAASPLSLTPLPHAASAELEVEVLRLLSGAGADLGEQVNVTRSPEGPLRVDGLVESAERKAELLRALRSVADNPAVQITINTVAEALSKQKPQAKKSTTEVIVEGPTTGSTIPAYADLHRYLTARGESGDQLEQDVQRFAARLTNLSYQTVQRAMALKRLAGRFSQEDLRTMDSEARAQWLALVRSHARMLQQEIAELRKDLSPVFPSGSSEGDEDADIRSDAALMQVADRLFTFCSEYDRAIHRALTLSPATSSAASVKSLQFTRNLQNAERLSAKISQYH